MNLVSLLGLLFFVSGYHFDNNWFLLASGILWLIAVIPLVLDYPIIVILMSILIVSARLYFFSPVSWYMHALWTVLILQVSVPMYRSVFIKR